MDAPLGRLRFLLPDAPEVDPGVPAGVSLSREGWPGSWSGVQGAVALAVVFACDVLAPCDRLPGLTAPHVDRAAPLPRDQVVARLGNLRDGRPRLDVIYGGACLQGSLAHAGRKALFEGDGMQRLRPGVLADARLGAHPLTLRVQAALAALHNALADDPDVADPRAAATALWFGLIRDEVMPRLCGPSIAAPIDRPQDLPLETVLGPFSTLLAMLTFAEAADRAEAALARQARRARRHNLPDAAALCTAFGLEPPATAVSLPQHLLDEARNHGTPFGPLGTALLSATVLALLADGNRPQDLPQDGRYFGFLATLRDLAVWPTANGR